MVKITVVARKPGTTAVDYSMEFEVPEIPRQGDYISVNRPDTRLVGEDFIVRHVWWKISYSGTDGFVSSEKPPVGDVVDIVVECDPALGPYSSERWRKSLEQAHAEGHVEEFQVSRMRY